MESSFHKKVRRTLLLNNFNAQKKQNKIIIKSASLFLHTNSRFSVCQISQNPSDAFSYERREHLAKEGVATF